MASCGGVTDRVLRRGVWQRRRWRHLRPKSSTAISKCMIMGGSVSTVYYNLKLKHPSLDMPLIEYDLALLMQPMLMLGVSIGVIFNVIFPNWLITALLITIFLVTSTKAYLKGFETWKKRP
ncbi:hypothetical protein BDA96_08G161800 [Sorghum bicolor]|uniref:Uncharacterized protein n=1 Tax=Sorghum bicolor TaxID=4558 RepID=A0A921U7T1_SORBI|nr:hypothetical protein BDA96_08G161800 [Sorghum bicolor]